MKRILLGAAALATLASLLAGCTMDGDRIVVTDPPRVTSNVTSSPAPVTPTRTPESPAVTPEGPGVGSEPNQGSGLTSGSGVDEGSGGAGQNSGAAGAKHTAAPGK